MFQTLWEYEIDPQSESDFVAIYGPTGEWVRLFSQYPGFIETELVRSVGRPNRFLTIDRWKSALSYEAFRAQTQNEYELMSPRCSQITHSIRHVGHIIGAGS